MGQVVQLVDHAPVCADKPQMIQWLRLWADALESGRYGEFRSVVLVVESDDGTLSTLCQSSAGLDRMRLVGLLQIAAHRSIDGEGRIETLREGA